MVEKWVGSNSGLAHTSWWAGIRSYKQEEASCSGDLQTKKAVRHVILVRDNIFPSFLLQESKCTAAAQKLDIEKTVFIRWQLHDVLVASTQWMSLFPCVGFPTFSVQQVSSLPVSL